MDLIRVFGYIPRLLPYLSVTFEYVAASMLIGLAVGFLLATAKLSKNKLLKSLAQGYTTILRCIPSIVLLFLVFYGLPPLLKAIGGIDIEKANPVLFAIITFSLFLSASLSELMRSSYEAIDHGQFEAAVSVGLSEVQAFRRIILPQAISVAIPNLGNTIIYMLKEGALCYIIGLIDVMGKASMINSNEMGGHVLEVYTALAVIYWVLVVLLEWVFRCLDKKLSMEH